MPSTSTTTTLTPRPRVAKVMTCALTDGPGNAVEARPPDRRRARVSAVEHASVARTAERLRESGHAKLDVIPVTPGGFVGADAVPKLVDSDVLLVSVIAANSETGVVNSAGEIAERAPAARLRDQFVGLRERLPGVHDLGDIGRRLPNTACLRFAGADGQAVVMQMDPVAVSLGSACHSGSIEPPATLVAMGIPREDAFEAVRFSVGRFTTGDEIELAVERTATAVEFVRERNR